MLHEELYCDVYVTIAESFAQVVRWLILTIKTLLFGLAASDSYRFYLKFIYTFYLIFSKMGKAYAD